MRQHCPCVAQHACFKEPLPTGVKDCEVDQSRTHRVRARHLPSANMFSREKPLTARNRPCLFTHFHSPTRPLSPTRLAFAASPPRQDPCPRVSMRFGPRSSLPGRALLARLGRSTPIPTTSGGRAGMQHRWGASVGCVRGCVRVGGDRVDVRGTVVPVAVRSVNHQLSRGRFSKRRSSRVSPAAMYVK